MKSIVANVADITGFSMEIRSLNALQTAENVTLQVELAGLANRLFAFMIDFLAMGSLMTVVVLFFSIMFSWGSELTRTVMPIVLFLVFFGFHFFQEWLWNGRTLGKHVFNIRVVRNNGQPVGFWEAFGRNILRVIDVYLMGIGLIVMMISPREKRFGDFLAGTLVVREQALEKPSIVSVWQPSSGEELRDRLTLEEQELLKAYQARRTQLIEEEREALSASLRQYFGGRLQLTPEMTQAPDFLDRLIG